MAFFVKTDKSKSLAHLTKDVEDQPLPPANDMLTMEHGNALFYYLKELPDTFRQICLKLYSMTAHGDVIVSTGMYADDSVKSLEKKKRGVADKLIVKGKPEDWKAFLQNEENKKKQLCELMHTAWSTDMPTTSGDSESLLILVKEERVYDIST